MKISIIVFFCVMMANLASSQNASPIKISGFIYDAESKSPLVGEISFRYKEDNTYQNTIRTDSEGKFELDALPKNLVLKVKAEGYFTSSITIETTQIVVPKIICNVPLVAQQQQQIDQIYLQSTTTKGHSIDNEKPNKNKNKTTHIFKAIDGINGKIIPAAFNLVFTQTNQTKHFSTNNTQSSFQVEFSQKDIIAIEVMADNYQKYLGNLIIETLDNQTHNNTAKLIRTLSFLNIITPNTAKVNNIEVIDLEHNEPIKPIQYTDTYFTLLSTQSKYRINVSYTDNTTDSKEIIAKEGINQLVFNIKALIEPAYETLYFEQSSVTLKQESMQKLEFILAKMKQTPELKIEITGHTDNTGNYHQNQYLAEFRAKYVSNFLFNKGIKPERIQVKGNGDTKPKVENSTEENKSQNRRVEIKLY